ncbi:MAG: nuclear transport factor 2 family protein [Kiloniellales bacterium]
MSKRKHADFAGVTAALQDYFDGIHEGDVEKLRGVFAPTANLYSSAGGDLEELSLAQYLERVAGRPSPASQGQTRTDRIVAIDFSGPDSAIAKVELSVPPRHFVDLLTFLRLDGRWRIVCKAYHVAAVD